jgi:hypothetical protein
MSTPARSGPWRRRASFSTSSPGAGGNDFAITHRARGRDGSSPSLRCRPYGHACPCARGSPTTRWKSCKPTFPAAFSPALAMSSSASVVWISVEVKEDSHMQLACVELGFGRQRFASQRLARGRPTRHVRFLSLPRRRCTSLYSPDYAARRLHLDAPRVRSSPPFSPRSASSTCSSAALESEDTLTTSCA